MGAKKENKENAGHRKALTDAHTDHQKGLTSRAYFKTSNHATSEDLVQETFMKTWVYLVKGGKIELMRAFLYHVLNNLIIDDYRKHKTISLEILLAKGFEPSADETRRMFDTLDGKEILLLIEKLPLKYRNVMRMRYVQDLSLQEMSLITGQSKNALTVQAHRGLEKLKLLYRHQ